MTTVTITRKGFVVAVLHFDTADHGKALDLALMQYPGRAYRMAAR